MEPYSSTFLELDMKLNIIYNCVSVMSKIINSFEDSFCPPVHPTINPYLSFISS